jgi:hypothetical protein
MEWVTCEKCGFTQVPSGKCLRCERIFERKEEVAKRPSRPPTAPALPPPPPSAPANRQWILVLAGLGILVAGVLIWRATRGAGNAGTDAGPAPTPGPSALDLTGRWHAQATVELVGPPRRPALKECYLETDRDGTIVGAGVLMTDPGRGGAGAGYKISPDAGQRLLQIAPLLAGAPRTGVALPVDFIPYPPWVPQRERRWRPLEGQRRSTEELRYILLESVEDDYLVQAGVNASGFLSWAYFSPEYASGRGIDALSEAIHPEAGASLRGFQNLIWDFSGSANFLDLVVNASVSGPEGRPVRMQMRR